MRSTADISQRLRFDNSGEPTVIAAHLDGAGEQPTAAPYERENEPHVSGGARHRLSGLGMLQRRGETDRDRRCDRVRHCTGRAHAANA